MDSPGERIDDVDRHPFRVAAALTLVGVAATIVYSLWVMPALTGAHHWWVNADVWPRVLAARYVSNGALGYLYSSDPFFTAMPLSAIVFAPIALLDDGLRLTDSYRMPVAHPSVWLPYLIYATALSGTLLIAARLLMREVWVRTGNLARGFKPNHAWTQVGLAVLVLVPAAIVYGRYEDILATACVLAGVRLVMKERWLGAALWFGAAISFDVWALIAVPLLVGLAPRAERSGSLVAALLLPGLLVALPFAVDPSHTSHALLHPLAFPTLGHALPWIRVTAQPVQWGLGRLLALVPAILVAWWIRGRREPSLVLAAFGIVFLLQPLFEGVAFAYLLCPGLVVLFLHERATGRSGLRTFVLGAGLLALFPIHPSPVLWWTVVFVVGTGLAWPAASELLGRREWEASPEPVAPMGEMAEIEPGQVTSVPEIAALA